MIDAVLLYGEVFMDQLFKQTLRWYSIRGAKRGLFFALIVFSLWCSWAIGYLIF